ncbi:MAG: RHS repeat-associated core domain-containing protein, partial [Bacteroidaceae bacterium]|nr:RHS repeat-associated core domain-containing protein [Bacteroidaceae bacterium]
AVTSYKYNKLDLIIEETNPEGAVTKYTYDERTNLIETEGYNKVKVKSEYNLKDELIKKTDAYGIETVYSYDERGNVISCEEKGRDLGDRKITYTYDEFNRLIKQEQPGQATVAYTYDDKDRVLTEAVGERKVTYTYDKAGRVLTQRDSNGLVTSYTYDSNNNVLTESTDGLTTTYAYDANGNLSSTTTPSGITQRNEYDKDGNLVAEYDGKGNATFYTYDRANNVVGITDKEGNKSCYVYDANGNLLAMTDTNDVTSRYEYDVMNRLIKVAEPDEVFVFYKYDKSGNMVKELTCDEEMDYSLFTGKSSKKEVNYKYSKTGELTAVISADTTSELYEYYNDGSLKKTIYPSGKTKEVSYDAFGNTKAVYLDNKLNVSYEYDIYNQLIIMNDVNGKTAYSYDNAGQIREVSSVGKTLKYAYDKLGRLDVLTYPDGRTAKYTYDEDSRISSFTETNGTKVDYVYDANGNVLEENRSDGISTVKTYDKLDRVSSVKTFRSNKLETSNDYTYDSAGRLIKENTLDSAGELNKTYSYSEAGKLTKVSELNPKNNNTKTVSYSYDTYGNRDKETIEETGKATLSYTYKYDDANRLKEKLEGNKQVAEFSYDKDGNLTQKSEGGHTYSYTYTSDNHMATSSIDGVITSVVTYDGNGLKTFELLRKTRSFEGEYTVEGDEVELDIKTRLKENEKALKSWEEYYDEIIEEESVPTSFDRAALATEAKSIFSDVITGKAFNKLAEYIACVESSLAPTASSEWFDFAKCFATDLVETIETVIPGFDPGDEETTDAVADEDTINAIKEAVSSKAGKPKYKLTKVMGKEADATDKYLGEEAYLEPTSYLYDLTLENAQVIAEYRTNGTQACDTYNFGAQGRTSSETNGAYLLDGRGSVVETVNNSRVSATFRYDAYGNITMGAPSQSRVYAYNGEQFTAQTGLIYLRARNYDATTGSFTTKDTYLGSKTDPVSRNRYTYGNNNPVNYIDPSGHSSLLSKLTGAVKTAANTVAKTATKVAATATKAVTSTAKAVSTAVSSAAKTAVSAAKTVVSTVKTAATTVTNKVTQVATTVKNTVSSAVSTAKTSVTNVVNNVVTSVSQVYNTAKTAVVNAVTTVKNTVSGYVTSAVNAVTNAYNTAADYVSNAYATVKAEVSQYISTKVEAVKATVSNAWENTKDSIEAGLDLVIEGKQLVAQGIQAAGEWWSSTDLSQKLDEAAKDISTAWTNSAIGKTVAAISESVDKAATVIKEKWDNSSIGQWCDKAANAVSNFYEEHQVLCDIIIGVAIIAICVAATVLIPGCSVFTAMAVEGLKGALLGAVTGTVGGAFKGSLEYYEENGTLDGSTSKVLESSARGFRDGVAAGAMAG